ncbi:DUF6414 family protein [Streptomyces sp. H39-C1]|uniref:DUF6414 family protein n=1 Tax=Streptomyces sp. H39-C1 TaxID=3004355 RepID=UPI0022AFF3FF|nr:hypothetical protein [Streptomyces sp. H39-C1]MCZ4095991.1 hypothetical protein [Streptomyces sp. H39-C1]
MTSQLRSGVSDVREYLYVDTPRVRTLLTQFGAGLPEGRRSERTRNWTASFAEVEELGNVEGSNEQEYRSLADLHVAMLEEDAESLDMLVDVSGISQKKKSWNLGRLHRELLLGSLIRVTGPTQVIDPSAFAASASAFDKFSEDSSFSQNVVAITEAMYRGHLALRVFPCGVDEWEYQYCGLIADPGGYLAAERSALFSRLGADPQEWTVVASISRIPSRDNVPPSTRFENAMNSIQSAFQNGPDSISRRALEVMIQEASRAMEGMGLSEAPTWPAIAVTPLAIYRKIQRSNITPDLNNED